MCRYRIIYQMSARYRCAWLANSLAARLARRRRLARQLAARCACSQPTAPANTYLATAAAALRRRGFRGLRTTRDLNPEQSGRPCAVSLIAKQLCRYFALPCAALRLQDPLIVADALVCVLLANLLHGAIGGHILQGLLNLIAQGGVAQLEANAEVLARKLLV